MIAIVTAANTALFIVNDTPGMYGSPNASIIRSLYRSVRLRYNVETFLTLLADRTNGRAYVTVK